MSSSQLDRIVKGAPPPNVAPEQIANAARRASASTGTSKTPSVSAPHALAQDPVSHLPSSPPQIYLNLLILESSLRAQYLSLRARLRLHVLLFSALAAWTLLFTYLLFLRPREDGKGTGGSVYWVVDTGEKMGFVGGAVTWGLVWATGLWDRGVRWPRRWVSVTNRGLRGFNLKVVVIKGSLRKEIISYLTLFGPFQDWAGTKGMRYEFLPRDVERTLGGDKERQRKMDDIRKDTWIEEDVAPGGDTIKLLLLPKPFSPDFREDWDSYRIAYWEKENERRVVLRKIVKARDRESAKKEGGWLWWTGWRGWQKFAGRPSRSPEQKQKSTRDKSSSTLVKKEKRKELSSDGHSRSSSRSSTPTPDPDSVRGPRRSTSDGLRRGSSTQRPIAKKTPSSSLRGSTAARGSGESRSSTPDSALHARNNRIALSKQPSDANMGVKMDMEIKKEETLAGEVVIKQEQE